MNCLPRFAGGSNTTVLTTETGTLQLTGAEAGVSTLVMWLSSGARRVSTLRVYSPWVLGHALPIPSPGATLELDRGEALAVPVSWPMVLKTGEGCTAITATAMSYGVWVLEAVRPGTCALRLTGAGVSREFAVRVRTPEEKEGRVVLRTRRLRIGDSARFAVGGELLPAPPSSGEVRATLAGNELRVVATGVGAAVVELRLEDQKVLVYPFVVEP